MYNWSVDEKYMRKFPRKYQLWRLEQIISYGLDGEKLDKNEVTSNWDYLKKRIDPERRKFLEFLLWPKQS
ncbi:hypothetical protein COY13_03335 [Candidatus Roizmanbacteria bacterium CG_4_10_14_0_2_um_filter_36_35]|uniref:Uncharacterized protein n=4 Tax=Candidatus Roizmaniibacteriota TaxID=1752723 RepID=A0A2M7BXY0_9BACT|nr:MAG: hypothetical protein COV86_04880 [Candidatus Roizmanbacteria bacterium CG11_big_fil_rev_8_21_14_0_20_35_14]PIV11433.1 MAG: hypothetical protein COS50_00215 [Candidatus Roizmanbacteria bacterium CG03_land_8_20_14_0_80_35_26]PIZ67350.1 MAG: hypothetical protein COY13_03335 [Candidatus Roizmanbacteria bacterium CG_4_10_14_0_2_um_filter_36_35]PJC31986.1 MAG: hypothetical protein CO049_03530 [Candidatus Roizmanbacteria bacterium CG_4_9_14_0_2_um_filter_36_12]PJC80764.1 MAG: hypothetical prot